MADLTRLGRYKLGRVLGRGAMGVVYEGLDPSLNRRVAIKTILKNAAIDAETAQMYSAQFSREAQAAGRLNHPNIVQVHDFAEEDQIAYLVMEYIQGRELRSYFEAKEKFEPVEAVRIMGELLDALDFAHEAGVIHRDVKPANVMLDAQRRVKLADFGVARIQDSERSAAGTMVGTPAWMSPEQIQGGKIDRRTDLFSAGVVLYQLLTGEQPFTGGGAWTVAKKIMQDDPPLPSLIAVSVSPVFDGIVNKALAKNPAERFASAREFAAALRSALAAGAQAPVQISPAAAARPKAGAAPKTSEAEVEFWRAIQNSTDPAELEFYLEQFAEGTYAPLARHKIAKLREPAEAARKAAEEQARQEAEAKEQARREAQDKAKRDAEERAKQVAAEKARREAEEKVRQAQALARLKQQEETAARARAAVDEDVTAAIGSARTAATSPAPSPATKKSFAIPAMAVAAVIVAGIVAYLLLGRAPAPALAPVAETPPAQKAATPPAAPVVDVAKIQRETEERVRKEFADKAAVERVAMEKAVAEKTAAEKAATEKMALAKTAAEKAAAEKAMEKAAAERVVAEKAAAEKAAAAKLAAEKAIADKAAAEKAAADSAAVEKAAAAKAAADKAPAEKAAAAKAAAVARKPGWPAVGDRWTYEVREANRPEKRYQMTIEVTRAQASEIHETQRNSSGGAPSYVHSPNAPATGNGPGIVNFQPYLHAFQEPRAGHEWPSVEVVRYFSCGANSSTVCRASARITGKERVTVKAGTYEAWVVALDIEIPNPGFMGIMRQHTYWYADEVRRFVKQRSRTRRGLTTSPDIDMELESYAPM